jgi:Cof subfamily protein (haloacid dehalogenase superfamily)
MDTTPTTTHEIKVIAVDLDGTLLNSQHTLSAGNRAALLAAMAAGVPVMLATGKTRASAEKLIAELGLTTPGVFVQGLLIYNPDGTVRHQQMLEPGITRRIITFAEDRGFDVLMYSGNRILVRRRDARADQVAEYGEPLPEVVGSLVNQLGAVTVNKLCIAGEPARMRALRWQLDQQMSGQVNFTFSHVASLLEVLPPGASKGRGVKLALQDLGIAPEHLLAIGDGENDIEMVKLAGVGVAVANAAPLLKAAAPYQVASNDADGVAEAIERFVLAPRRPAPPVPAADAAPAADAPAAEQEKPA